METRDHTDRIHLETDKIQVEDQSEVGEDIETGHTRARGVEDRAREQADAPETRWTKHDSSDDFEYDPWLSKVGSSKS